MTAINSIFIIKGINASQVNLVMNDYAAGLPSPLSFLGLGDVLARKLELKPWSASILPILHKVTISEGRTKPEMSTTNSSKFGPIEITENMIGSVHLTLLLSLPGCHSQSSIQNIILGCRIAGGLIQKQVEITEEPPDGRVFTKIKRGYAIIPPTEKKQRLIASGNNDDLVSIARMLEAKFANGDWLVPVSVGYKLIEDPDDIKVRKYSRCDNVPHVFAEPVLGIAKLVSVRNPQLTQLNGSKFKSSLWSWDICDDLILGHSTYRTN